MNDLVLSKLPSLSQQILNEIELRVSKEDEKNLSDQELLTLHSLFGGVLIKALDILEKYHTLEVYMTSDKLRVLIEVKGEQDRCYRLFERLNYCPCSSFKHQVIESKNQVCCKHILASRLALILGKTVETIVTKEQYLMLLRSMFDFENNG